MITLRDLLINSMIICVILFFVILTFMAKSSMSKYNDFVDYSRDKIDVIIDEEYQYDCFCNNTCNPVKCNVSYSPRIENKIVENGAFYDLLQQVPKDRPYEIDISDCDEMSEELKRRLEFMGFKGIRTLRVIVDCDLEYKGNRVFESSSCERYNGSHRIVTIGGYLYLEATLGQIIPPALYRGYGIK